MPAHSTRFLIWTKDVPHASESYTRYPNPRSFGTKNEKREASMAGIQLQPLNLLVAVLVMVVCVSSSAQTASFVARTDFLVGQGPSAVATADLNADGKLDLVTSNEFSNSVSVLLGNGDGTFQPAVSYPVGANPIAVSIGDFTGDGKLDIFTVNSNSSVSVLLGNGDGTFQSQVATNIVTNQLSDVTVGDFNGDGKLDLAMPVSGSKYLHRYLGQNKEG
jgi:hypothetical protein